MALVVVQWTVPLLASAGADAALVRGDSRAERLLPCAGVGRGRHGRAVPAAGRRRRLALRLRPRRKPRSMMTDAVPPYFRRPTTSTIVHRPRTWTSKWAKRRPMRDGRRARRDDAGRRMAFAADDPARGGRRGAVRPAPDQRIRARRALLAGVMLLRPRAVSTCGSSRRTNFVSPRRQPGDGRRRPTRRSCGDKDAGLPCAEPHGQPLQRRHDLATSTVRWAATTGRSWPRYQDVIDRYLSVERRSGARHAQYPLPRSCRAPTGGPKRICARRRRVRRGWCATS